VKGVFQIIIWVVIAGLIATGVYYLYLTFTNPDGSGITLPLPQSATTTPTTPAPPADPNAPIDIDRVRGYVGMPRFTETDTTLTDISLYVESRDRSQALVFVATRDKTQPPDEFAANYIITSEREYRCVHGKNECYPSTLLGDAYDTYSRAFNNYPARTYPRHQYYVTIWQTWNAATGELFGYPDGEGGPREPVVTYDPRTKLLTTIYYSGHGHLVKAFISPSFNRVLVANLDTNSLDVYARQARGFAKVASQTDPGFQDEWFAIEPASVTWADSTVTIKGAKKTYTISISDQ
jgi:hypothetical protein